MTLLSYIGNQPSPPLKREALLPARVTLRTREYSRASLFQQYHSLKLNLVPLLRGTKKPAFRWKGLQERKIAEEEFHDWFFGKKEYFDVGLICGSTSGGLVVLDFERLEDYLSFFPYHAKLEDKTLVVQTPDGGTHVHFRSPQFTRTRIRFCKSHPLDVLGEGSYAVTAPSSFCGRQYRVVGALKIADYTGDIYKALEERFKVLGWDSKTDKQGSVSNIGQIISGVPEGQRNVSAFKYARHLFFFVRLDESTTWFELKRWNNVNKPPLDERELLTIFRSARNYPHFASDRRSLPFSIAGQKSAQSQTQKKTMIWLGTISKSSSPPICFSTNGCNYRIVNDDFTTCSLEENHVDLVLTDPPYVIQYLELWDNLGQLARKVLKPGKFLVAYAGSFTFETQKTVLSKYLTFREMKEIRVLGIRDDGWNKRNVGIAETKPILIFQKEPLSEVCPRFDLKAGAMDKTWHEWGQPVSECVQLLHGFSEKGDLVFEPFAGGGTTIQACIETKRHCTAFEINNESFGKMKERFAIFTRDGRQQS